MAAPYDLTGKKVSLTYENLVQYIDSSFYNGLGESISITSGGVSQTYVDASLNAKANISDVSAALTLKANISDVSAALALKANISDVSIVKATYIPDVSLGNEFVWTNGILNVDVSTAAGTISGLGNAGKVTVWRDTAYVTHDDYFTYDVSNHRMGIGPGAVDPSNPASIDINSGTVTSINAIIAKGEVDNYYQINLQNTNTGSGASTDIVATANNGTETDFYIDMGINGSAFGGNTGGINSDAYIYAMAENLVIQNAKEGKHIVFSTNGADAYANEKMRITSDGSVFIGKITGKYRLDVAGDVNTDTTYRISGVPLSSIYPSFSYVNSSLGTRDACISTKVSGSGVLNEIAIWNGAGAIIGDTKLIFDPVNNRLGIGTLVLDPSNPATLTLDSGNATSHGIASLGSFDGFFETYVKNSNTGNGASSDIVAKADNGETSFDIDVNYIDMGINNSGYSSGYMGNANDAYVYSAGQNLIIGNKTVDKDIIFFVGGTDPYATQMMSIGHDGSIVIGGTGADLETYSLKVYGNVDTLEGGTYKINNVPLSSIFATFSYVDGSYSRISYVDSSLALRDTSISWLLVNKQPLGAYISDASLSKDFWWNNNLLDISTSYKNQVRNIGTGTYKPWSSKIGTYNEFRSLDSSNGIILYTVGDGSTYYIDTSINVPGAYIRSGIPFSGNLVESIQRLFLVDTLTQAKVSNTFYEKFPSGVTQLAAKAEPDTSQGSYMPWGTTTWDASGNGSTITWSNWRVSYGNTQSVIKSSLSLDVSAYANGTYAIYFDNATETPVVSTSLVLDRRSFETKAYIGHVVVIDGSVYLYHESPDLYATGSLTRDRSSFGLVSVNGLTMTANADGSTLAYAAGTYLLEGGSYKNVDFYNEVFSGSQNIVDVAPNSLMTLQEVSTGGFWDTTKPQYTNILTYKYNYFEPSTNTIQTYTESPEKFILAGLYLVDNGITLVRRGTIFDTLSDALAGIPFFPVTSSPLSSVATQIHPQLGYFVISTSCLTTSDSTKFTLQSIITSGSTTGGGGGGGTGVSGALNLGAGTGIYTTVASNLIQLKGLSSGNTGTIKLSTTSDTILIDASIKNDWDLSINILYNTKTDKTYSTGVQDVSIAKLDASIITIFDFISNVTYTDSYLDGSLALKTNVSYSTGIQDVSIALAASQVYVDGSFAQRDASIVQALALSKQIDATYVYVDGSLATKTSFSYVDTSLNVKTNVTYTKKQDASMIAMDASITRLFDEKADITYVDTQITALEVSISSLKTHNDIQDNSIYSLTGRVDLLDSSVTWLTDNKVNNSTLTFYTTKLYVDGSLSKRDASINTLFALAAQVTYTDSYLDGSLALKADKSSTDASLALKTNLLYSTGVQDVSIGLKADKTYVDGSLALKTDFTYDIKQDTSIAALKVYIDGSLALKTDFTYDIKQDTSIILKADKTYVDNSLGYFIRSASTGTGLYWVNGLLDVSVASGTGDVTKAYVDGSLAKMVPYIGATQDLSLGTHSIRSIESIIFNQIPTVTRKDGQLFWDSSAQTLALHTGTDVTLQIGQEQFILGYNDTGSPILNGSVVYITGTYDTDIPTIGLAQADITATAQAIGVTTQDIPDGQHGFITVFGIVHDVSTGNYSPGQFLYLSDTTPGALTQTAPITPSTWVRVAKVLEPSHTAGSIYVYVQIGRSITTLTDVGIVSPALNQTLVWNGSKWINSSGSTVSAGSGVTYFLSDVASNVPTYESMWTTPEASTQVIEIKEASINHPKLIDNYLSEPSTGLGIDQITGGIWEFNTYASVSNVDVSTEIKTYVFKRDYFGLETSLFNVTTDLLNSQTVLLYTTTTVQPTFNVDPSDRLLFRYEVYTQSPTDVSVSFYHGGTTNYTHVHTPLATSHNDLLGIQGGLANQIWHLSTAQLTVVENTSGINTGDQSLGYLASKVDVEASTNDIWTKLGSVDTSLNNLGIKNGQQDVSINSIWTKIGYIDISLNSTGSGDVTKAYVDGSLALKTNLLYSTGIQDVSIASLKTNVESSLNTIYIKLGSVDTSLNNLGIKNGQQDVSISGIWTKIGNVDTSLNNLGIKDGNQDVSLNLIWTSFTTKTNLDTSLNNVYIKLGSVDTSLNNLGIKNGNIDTSLNNVYIKLGSVDTSLNNLGIKNGQQDVSIAFNTNHQIVDASAATDTTAYGMIMYLRVTADTSFGDVGHINLAGTIDIAKADISANASAIVMCTQPSGVAANGTGEFMMQGTARNNLWNWTTGGLIYLSATGTKNNTLAQAPPSGAGNVSQVLGVATATHSMIFNPSLVQVERV